MGRSRTHRPSVVVAGIVAGLVVGLVAATLVAALGGNDTPTASAPVRAKNSAHRAGDARVFEWTKTPDEQWWIPEGVCQITMTAIGGEGAWAGSGIPGSVGGSATATIPVTVTGPALTIVVGGRGGTRIVPDNGVQDPERTHATGSQGGSSGPDGGRGGDSVGERRGHPAGGGGGASYVKGQSGILVMGGGGGGNGLGSYPPPNGGKGGGKSGDDGIAPFGAESTVGRGGTQDAAGAGGGPGANAGDNHNGGTGTGGGGGGGWKGGGAGAIDDFLDAGGGGGGSSYTPDGTGLVTGVQAQNYRNGRVTLSYVPGEGCTP